MWLLSSVVCFGLAVLLHGAALRLPLRFDAVTRFLLVAAPLGGALVILWITGVHPVAEAFAAMFLYAFLCELYIFCFTLVMSSVSATMLILLRRGPVAASALASTYDPRGMVELRLDRLIKNGLIERNGERLAVTFKGKRLHRAFGALRRFFRHEPA